MLLHKVWRGELLFRNFSQLEVLNGEFFFFTVILSCLLYCLISKLRFFLIFVIPQSYSATLLILFLYRFNARIREEFFLVRFIVGQVVRGTYYYLCEVFNIGLSVLLHCCLDEKLHELGFAATGCSH